jgi:hypothetical protein
VHRSVGARRYGKTVTLFAWAYEVAEFKLADVLPQRWSHVQGAAKRARELRPISGSNADLLEAAAVLHDVGYAPDIAHTGFHPLDGARFLIEINAPLRLVNLVAQHSYAALEAELRGLADELAGFEDERGSIRDALWYCDLTTAPNGDQVSAHDRIHEIEQRHGPRNLITTFITAATPELLATVGRTERRAAVVAV